MEQVRIKRSKLLKIVKKNKSDHRKLYKKAHAAFVEKAIDTFTSLLHSAERSEVSLHVNLIEPQDHTVDYERVIKMLELEVEDTVLLQQHEFAQLVQDEWDWQNQFVNSFESNTGTMYMMEKGSLGKPKAKRR